MNMCKGRIYSNKKARPSGEIVQGFLVVRNQFGFMDLLGHIIAIVVLGILLPIAAIKVRGWVDSKLAFWVVMIIIFIPLNIIALAIGDLISRLTR